MVVWFRLRSLAKGNRGVVSEANVVATLPFAKNGVSRSDLRSRAVGIGGRLCSLAIVVAEGQGAAGDVLRAGPCAPLQKLWPWLRPAQATKAMAHFFPAPATKAIAHFFPAPATKAIRRFFPAP